MFQEAKLQIFSTVKPWQVACLLKMMPLTTGVIPETSAVHFAISFSAGNDY